MDAGRAVCAACGDVECRGKCCGRVTGYTR